MSPQEMFAYQKDIDDNIEKFRNIFKRADQIRSDYLEKAQKDRAFKGGLAVGAAAAGLAGMPIVGAGGALILNKVSEGIKSKNGVMKDIVGQSKENIQSITEDIGKIESYEKIISDWVEISENPIEIVSVDDEFYVNIPGAESVENLNQEG